MHPTVSEQFLLSDQKCRRKVWCGVTHQPIVLLLCVARTVARGCHQLYMLTARFFSQTDRRRTSNKGACSNLVAYDLLLRR